MSCCFSLFKKEYYVQKYPGTELVVSLLEYSKENPRVLKNLEISHCTENEKLKDLYNFSNPGEEKITVSKTSEEVFHKGRLIEMKNHKGYFQMVVSSKTTGKYIYGNAVIDNEFRVVSNNNVFCGDTGEIVSLQTETEQYEYVPYPPPGVVYCELLDVPEYFLSSSKPWKGFSSAQWKSFLKKSESKGTIRRYEPRFK